MSWIQTPPPGGCGAQCEHFHTVKALEQSWTSSLDLWTSGKRNYASRGARREPGRLSNQGAVVGGDVFSLESWDRSQRSRTPTAQHISKLLLDKQLKACRGSRSPSVMAIAGHMVSVWPTPAARDWKSPSPGRKGNSRPLSEVTGMASMAEGKTPRALNPEWIEWMMGYAPGWTELSGLALAWFKKQGKRDPSRN